MNDMIKKAHQFAVAAHKDQKRKFTEEPYVVHLEGTAQLVWEATDGNASYDVYVAAILHDVVEDTDVELMEVGREFGGTVMSLVKELTINEQQKKKLGKKIYLAQKINQMSAPAFLIKLCDRLHNVTSLIDKRVPTNFIKWYCVETQYIIDNLDRYVSDLDKGLISRIEKTLAYLKLNREF
jgi:(p)ppGpp synthase/HD superfamily hydrolase